MGDDLSMFDRLQRKKQGTWEGPIEAKYTLARRTNKSCPTEVTSKRAVGRHKNILAIEKPTPRDPRFDSFSGTFNEELYKRAYSFLDERREAEIEDLKKMLKRLRAQGKATASTKVCNFYSLYVLFTLWHL